MKSCDLDCLHCTRSVRQCSGGGKCRRTPYRDLRMPPTRSQVKPKRKQAGKVPNGYRGRKNGNLL